MSFVKKIPKAYPRISTYIADRLGQITEPFRMRITDVTGGKLCSLKFRLGTIEGGTATMDEKEE